MTTRYFIELSFQGSSYHGWQIQPNALTVQEVLNRDLSILLAEDIRVTGCGRTDTGVHAKKFFAHFDTTIKNLEKNKHILHRINGKLPDDISVHEIIRVKHDAHARFDAISRTYEYHINRSKEVFSRELSHYIYGELNTRAMQAAADTLKDYSDFTSFSKADTDTKTNDCRIYEAVWEYTYKRMIFRVTADRFLRNMVRAMVGTLLETGFGKKNPDDFRDVIESRDRSKAGTSVPAKGLFLTDIKYPAELFLV